MRTWLTVLFLLAPAVGAGCAAPIQSLTKTQYVNPAFSSDQLNAGGLALLPITAGHGQEGYRRPLGECFNDSLQRAIPHGEVLTWQAAMDSLNRHDLVAHYQDMIETYQKTSILNRTEVTKLRTALGVRYALYCSLQDFSRTTHTSYGLFTGPSTTKTANVAVHCLVLDLVSGDIMQEIIGQATSRAGELMYTSPYEEFAASIARSVLSQLPGSLVSPDLPLRSAPASSGWQTY